MTTLYFSRRPLFLATCALSAAILSACAGTPETPDPMSHQMDSTDIPIATIETTEQSMNVSVQTDSLYDEQSEQEAPETAYIYANTHVDEPLTPESPSDTRLTEESQSSGTPTELNQDSDMTVLIIENIEQLQAQHTEQQPLQIQDAANDSLFSETGVAAIEQDDEGTISEPDKRIFHFGFNQSQLSEEDIRLLEAHAEYLSTNPELVLTINGHTDKRGNATYNVTLSEQRAKKVKSLLVQMGVQPERIKIVGWGGTYPLVSEQNYAENRRIELDYQANHIATNQ